MRRLAWACFATLCLIPHLGRGDLVDDFDNGVVADSDSSTGYWGVNSFGGSANAVSESNSLLTITVGDDDGSNESDFGGVALYSNAFRSDLDFLNSPFLVQARGIQMQSQGSPHINHDERHLRVGFLSSGASAFAADDAVFVRVFETGISLRSKSNESDTNGQGTQQANIAPINGIGGFDWEIGPGAAGMLDYSLTAYFLNGSVADSTSGSFAYDASQWNQPDSASRLLVMAQELNVTGGEQYFTASIDSLSVTSASMSAVREPGYFALSGLVVVGFGCLHFRRFRNLCKSIGCLHFRRFRKLCKSIRMGRDVATQATRL